MNFTATQILREIKFEILGVSKTAILTILAALNFDYLENFTLAYVKNSQKCKIKSCKKGQNGSLWPSKISKNWFHTVYLVGNGRTITEIRDNEICFTF